MRINVRTVEHANGILMRCAAMEKADLEPISVRSIKPARNGKESE